MTRNHYQQTFNIFRNSQQLCHCCVYGTYIEHKISDSKNSIEAMLYQTKLINRIHKFMFAFLNLYFSSDVFIGKRRLLIIQC